MADKALAGFFLVFCFLAVASSSPTSNENETGYKRDVTPICRKYLPNFNKANGSVISLFSNDIKFEDTVYSAVSVSSKNLDIETCTVLKFTNNTFLNVQIESKANIELTNDTFEVGYSFRAHTIAHFKLHDDSLNVYPLNVEILSTEDWHFTRDGLAARPDPEQMANLNENLVPQVSKALIVTEQFPIPPLPKIDDETYVQHTLSKLISDLSES